MGILLFAKVIFETLKPYRYRGLTQRSILKTFTFFLSLTLVYLLVLGAVNVPGYYKNYAQTGSNMSGFEKFSINIDLQTKEPVVLSDSPRIVVDTSDNRTLGSKEDFLVTKDTVYSKFLFWTKKTGYSDYDVLSNMNKVKRNTFLLFLVFIPTLFVFAYILTLLKYFAIVCIFSILAGVYVLVRRNRVSVLEVIKAAVYCLTIYYIVNIVASIFGIKYLGFIAYLVYFIVVMFFMRDNTVLGAISGDE